MQVDCARPVSTSTATPLRVQVRGVVTVPLLPLEGTVIPSTLVFLFRIRTVVPALEVFDNDTGWTLVILSNPVVIPGFFSCRFSHRLLVDRLMVWRRYVHNRAARVRFRQPHRQIRLC